MAAEYLLGIDTGGTCTDGVLVRKDNQEVVKSIKTLTTKPDLSGGILAAMAELIPEDPGQIKLVVISTTLATNAIAEGKGRPVGLFLLGYDPELIRQFSLDSRFAADSFHYFEGGHDLYANQQAPLDTGGIAKTAQEIKDQVEAIAISGYFSPFNASHEEQAFQIVAETIDHPVVLGNQLSTRLDSVQRATTAALNASLLSHLQGFIQSMQASLKEQGVTAPLMVVRGDGALVSAGSAQRRPIETVHSGPAASAIGGQFLAGLDKALVIDLGGTTTDIALIDEGQVQIKEEGTSVGRYRTAVRAANIHSLGLGGDSQIQITIEDQLQIGPARVRPISSLAESYPGVLRHLKQTAAQTHKLPNLREIEFWYLIRSPSRIPDNPRTIRVLELLENGPVCLAGLLKKLEIFHPLQSGALNLIREEVIGVAGLTPTDLFHIRGDYAPWNVEAARIAAGVMAGHLRLSEGQFIQKTLRKMVDIITRESITYLTGQSLDPEPFYTQADDLGLWLYNENKNNEDPYLGSQISLKMPLVGIGGPANLILPGVADLLHTRYISPPHHQVANAVGAAVGSVIAYQEAWVIPQSRNLRTVGYYVQSGSQRQRFRTLQEALDYAETAVREAALTQAINLGLTDPLVEIIQLPDGAESYRVRALVAGKPEIETQNQQADLDLDQT